MNNCVHHCCLGFSRCQEVEEAFANVALGEKDALKLYNELQIKQLTKLIEVTRTNLSKADRQKVMNM